MTGRLSEAWLAGSEAWLAGSGGDGRMDEQTNRKSPHATCLRLLSGPLPKKRFKNCFELSRYSNYVSDVFNNMDLIFLNTFLSEKDGGSLTRFGLQTEDAPRSNSSRRQDGHALHLRSPLQSNRGKSAPKSRDHEIDRGFVVGRV